MLGLLNQIVVLPVLAYVLISVFDTPPAISMGILLLAACPGGATSNLMTYLAKSDVALSVTLTAVNSVIAIITIPLIVNFGLDVFMSDADHIESPVQQISSSLFLVIGLPLSIGMFVKRKWPGIADKMDKPVRIGSIAIMFLIIIGLCIKEKDNLILYFENSLPIALSLNIIGMLIGYFASRIANLNFKQALCISIETGNQNGTLAIFVAISLLGQPEVSITAGVYALVMYTTSVVPILIGHTKHKSSLF